MTDQYDRWRTALEGEPLDLGDRGDPPAGFYRKPIGHGEFMIFAVWRDEANKLKCWRSHFGGGSKLTDDEIDEMFADKNVLAIPHEVFQDCKAGGELPPVYRVTLRTKDMLAGTRWTRKWAEGQMAAQGLVMQPPGIGHNAPQLTDDERLAKQIDAISIRATSYLLDIGGEPTTKEHADTLADFATAAQEIKTAAETKHKAEKEPHLKAGRAVDSKWFKIRDAADKCRKDILASVQRWINVEKARREAAARAAAEEQRKLAEAQADAIGDAPPPAPVIDPERVRVGNLRTVSTRTREVWRVDDEKAFVDFLFDSENADFYDALNKIANKIGPRGGAPGLVKEIEEKVA